MISDTPNELIERDEDLRIPTVDDLPVSTEEQEASGDYCSAEIKAQVNRILAEAALSDASHPSTAPTIVPCENSEIEVEHHRTFGSNDPLLLCQLDSKSYAPEVLLQLATLEDAFELIQGCSGVVTRAAKRIFDEELEWFFSPDYSHPFTFENVCCSLDLEPDYLRRGLIRWLARQNIRHSYSNWLGAVKT